MTEHFEDRLTALWTECEERSAAATLGRSIGPDQTLVDVLRLLSFAPLRKHLAKLRLCDVLPAACSAQADPPPQKALIDAAEAVPPAIKKRTRRSAGEMQEIKDLIVAQIRTQPDGVGTPQVCQFLAERGYQLSFSQTAEILAKLASAQQLLDTGSKPKRWRTCAAKPAGARVMIIKKAQHELTSPSSAGQQNSAHVAHNEIPMHDSMGAGLMSQSQINAAAEVLRRRYFTNNGPAVDKKPCH